MALPGGATLTCGSFSQLSACSLSPAPSSSGVGATRVLGTVLLYAATLLLRTVRYCSRLCCYAQSGTALWYATTLLLHAVRYCPGICCYAFGTRCPVPA
eukprot:1746432-Rhodomonas_salina.2